MEEELANNVISDSHDRLLQSVAVLDGTRPKIQQRREACPDASEFTLGSSKKRLTAHDMTRLLGSTTKDQILKKRFTKIRKKKKVLPAPLSKVHENKIKRELGYKKVQKEVEVWQNVIEHNRLAELHFPLSQPDVKLITAKEFASKFEPKTTLEKEIYKVINENPQPEKEMMTDFEKEALSAMSLEEAKERKSILSKMRAQESYAASKARRQNRIKSKKYHRILKRERIKKKLAEFEELKKKNPEAALEKLKELDKIRIKERMSLKHRSTGKWAKAQAIRAKYDAESREALAEQLQLNRELKQKLKPPDINNSENSDDDIVENNVQKENKPDKILELYKNSYLVVPQPVDTSVTSSENKTVKSSESKNKRNRNIKKRTPWFVEDKVGEVLLAPEDFSEEVHTWESNDNRGKKSDNNEEQSSKEVTKTKTQDNTVIDPTKFVRVSTVGLKSQIPDMTGGEDEWMDDNDDDETSRKHLIAEAFAGDDVIEDFRKEKEDEIENSAVKDFNLCLPGWGDWGGKGLEESYNRKKKNFTLKASQAVRKDYTLGNVILSEDRDEKLRKLQVSELPFPFTTVADFESSIRQPLGKTFIPETAHTKLIQPKILTKSGTIIDPIDRNEVIDKIK